MINIKNTQLIGIAGRAGSGKNTVAHILTDMVGRTTIQPFALPLKQAISKIFGCTLKTLEDRNLKSSTIPNFNVTYRHAMQTLGTEWGRNMIDKDIWLKICQDEFGEWKERQEDEIANDELPERFFIVPDVRFDNEAKWIQENGILLVVERPVSEEAPMLGGHASEVMPGYNPLGAWWKIENKGDIQDLRVQVIDFLAFVAKL